MKLKLFAALIASLLAPISIAASEEGNTNPIEESLLLKPPINLGSAARLHLREGAEFSELWQSLGPQLGAIFVVIAGPEGNILECRLRDGRVLDDGVVRELCNDLISSVTVSEYSNFYSGGRRGILGVSLYAHAEGETRRPRAAALSELSEDFLDYEPATIAPDKMLKEDDGELVLPTVYPARALRMEIQGNVSVLLGVSPGGRILKCRPTVSIGWAWMDYRTCMNILRRGRFSFVADQNADAAIRYLETTVAYRLN